MQSDWLTFASEFFTKNYNKMKKILMYALVASMAIFTSCKKDDDNDVKQGPKVSAPAASEALVNATVDVEFSFTAAGGFASSAVTASNGTATVKTDGTADAASGTIIVSFTGSAAGAGSVTLSVTDKAGLADDATAVVNVVAEQTTFRINSNITEDATWETGKIYILESRIAVEPGATLTIQPGVVVKGEAGTGANATVLLVARGGKLMAEGTADAPIIFTTIADEIIPGQIESPNLESDVNGLWGGVIVLGSAKISASNESGEDVVEVQIEGIPTSDPNGLYGGTNDADNSGVIKYISIRHGGTNIGSGNEINGLTLGGVGSGTVIENVEVVANQDDGIEWFGGTVNVKNIVVWNVGDDGLDTDQSWSGTADNFYVVTVAGHNFELDGPEGSYQAGHTIKNGTVVASNADRSAEDLINVDENSIVTLQNIYITSILEGMKINRVTAVGVVFDNIMLDVPAADLANYVNGAVPAGVVAGGSTGADSSVFGWTWASKAGGLTGL